MVIVFASRDQVTGPRLALDGGILFGNGHLFRAATPNRAGIAVNFALVTAPQAGVSIAFGTRASRDTAREGFRLTVARLIGTHHQSAALIDAIDVGRREERQKDVRRVVRAVSQFETWSGTR